MKWDQLVQTTINICSEIPVNSSLMVEVAKKVKQNWLIQTIMSVCIVIRIDASTEEITKVKQDQSIQTTISLCIGQK